MADAPADPQAPGTPLPPAINEGPIPVPPNTKVGNMYEDYDPKGAMGGLFAPAYLKGFAPSEQAVGDYYSAKNHMSDSQLEETRMPWPWMAPRAVNSMTYGTGAAGIPEYLAYGDKRGLMDPNALKAAAQSLPYDMDARRSQIAQQLSANQAASDSYRQQHLERYGYYPEEEARGPFAGYGGDDPRFGGQGASGWRQAQQAAVGQPLFPGGHVAPPSTDQPNFMNFMSGG